MQSVRSVKKVSYKYETLSYAQARALYHSTEQSIDSRSSNSRDFIINRWRLGRYFYMSIPSDQNELSSWIEVYWPEVSKQSIKFWINFSKECPHYLLKMISNDDLKKVFLEKAVITSCNSSVFHKNDHLYVENAKKKSIMHKIFLLLNRLIKKFIKSIFAYSLNHSKTQKLI